MSSMISADSSILFRRRKIVVLGSRAAGKSAILGRYLTGHFCPSYYPTIENVFNTVICISGVEYDCEIFDTAGHDEYSILNAKYAIGIHGYILVYSVASRSSFEMVQIIHNKIVDITGLSSVPTVIVGSKTDVPRREVGVLEAQELAEKLGCAFVETSANEDINIDTIFSMCLEEIHKPYKNRIYIDNGQKNCNIM